MVYNAVMNEIDVRITLRLPKALHDALHRRAREEDRSLNGQIVHLLRQALAPEPPRRG